MAGPALLAAANPVIENKPAPMMAPIPRAINALASNVLFNVWLPVSLASCNNPVIDFFIKILIRNY